MPASIEITPRLFATDFDGTCARTFDPSPNNIDVHVAYERAIVDTFGKAALLQYREEGGLNNRAPSEITASLQPSADTEQQRADTEALISAKLGYLMGEIGVDDSGTMWPKPVPGFLEFWQVLQSYRARTPIDTAILSSGHTEFITKTFNLWQAPQPDIIVSDDTMRGLPEGCLARGAVKPDKLLMRVVQARWNQLRPASHGLPAAECIFYAGDDVVKDGGLAKNSGVPFIHVPPEQPHTGWLRAWGILGLTGVIRAQ